MATVEFPIALRARAEFRTTLFGRKKQVFRYDALFDDGRVAEDVDAGAALESGRFPADAWATRRAAEAACPGVGVGPWVEYATGRLLDGPAAG